MTVFSPTDEPPAVSVPPRTPGTTSKQDEPPERFACLSERDRKILDTVYGIWRQNKERPTIIVIRFDDRGRTLQILDTTPIESIHRNT